MYSALVGQQCSAKASLTSRKEVGHAWLVAMLVTYLAVDRQFD